MQSNDEKQAGKKNYRRNVERGSKKKKYDQISDQGRIYNMMNQAETNMNNLLVRHSFIFLIPIKKI